MKRPNILWISFEDTSPRYGCYGDPIARTPNVDRLAAEGCVWTQAYSSAPVCAPARSAVITGMYAISVGAHHMRTTHVQEGMPDVPTPYSAVLPAHVKCVTEYFRAAGYYCTNRIKTDYQFEPPATAWDELSMEAHWRNRPDPDQPFFAVFNFEESHESQMWPKDEETLQYDPDEVILPPYFPDTPAVRETMARMYSNITDNDRRLGRLLDQLEEDGLADNTIVMHWSDHGPLPRGKRWLYDAGLQVPMIVRWPGHIKPGSRSKELVSTIDLAPTVLSLAGLDVPQHLQGQCFIGQDAEPRDYIFASRDRLDSIYDRVRGARDQRYKYIRNYYPEKGRAAFQNYLHRMPIMQDLWRLHLEGELTELQEEIFFAPNRPTEELYDTEADPDELRNLAADPEFGDELKRLRGAVDEWIDDVGDWGEVNEFEMVRQWYPDGVQPQTAKPLAVVIDANHPAIDYFSEDVQYQTPALLMLECSTEGASIAWRYEDDPADRWRLYSKLIRLSPDDAPIQAKAVRIGYAESEPVTLRVQLTVPAATPS